MSHQDDLEMEYKSASNELPSELSDQIILQAAKDAVTPDMKSSNVVKGKFSSRKWHTPVSIAAAAVITVSVVTSLQPWNVIPVNSPAPLMSEEHQMEEMLFDTASVESDKVQLREKETFLAQEISGQKIERHAYKKRAKAVADVEQAVLTETKLIASPVTTDTTKSLTILEWLDEIETDIHDDDATKAKAKTLMLIKQYPLEFFSEKEQERFKNIQNYLTAHK